MLAVVINQRRVGRGNSPRGGGHRFGGLTSTDAAASLLQSSGKVLFGVLHVLGYALPLLFHRSLALVIDHGRSCLGHLGCVGSFALTQELVHDANVLHHLIHGQILA